MITTILWDVDGTLLDFLAAEKAAIRTLFAEFGFGECTDEAIARYSKINRRYWEKLENGELTKPEVLVGRFREFFETEGLDVTAAPAFNERYQVCLGDTIVKKILIVGDSLTSDIRGGNLAQIVTCWYNPNGQKADSTYRIDAQIQDLQEVIPLLSQSW